ncbi:MAG: carboxypeptidase-like regulatory domain-containing protein [Bryobacteraceae bacterium]
MKKILAVAGAALLLLCAAPRAGAQSWKKQQEPTVRSVQGIVTDHAGKPVAGAVVYLKDTKTLQIRSFITKEDGGYAFHGISINVDYELKAEHEGAKSDTRTLSVFDSRKEPVMDLKLKKSS